MLTVNELKRLVDWKPIAPGFGRAEENAYELKVRPIFREIERFEKSEVRIMTDGGLSNYASAFAHNRKGDCGNIEGVYVYLSLLAPIAAVGRDAAYISDKARGYSMIEPGAVLGAEDLKSHFEKFVWRSVKAGGYQFLSPKEATAVLPSGIEPYEYCLNNEPWNRVFHALFSDTD